MSGIGFNPLTEQYGIARTSYEIQIGLINGKWAIRMIRGKDIVNTMIYREDDLIQGFPPPDLTVRWVIGAVAVPNINPRQIKQTVLILLNRVKTNKDKKKAIGSIKETKKVKLKPVPKPDLKRCKISGSIVEDKPKDTREKKDKEFLDLENNVCASCRTQIKFCPNCGSEFHE